ncbi:MAG: hypothetical protein ABL958_03600 [Bdellovibrionia bacterium]
MKNRGWIVTLAIIVGSQFGCVPAKSNSVRDPAQAPVPPPVITIEVTTEQALAAFTKLHVVATGTRCTNCHVTGERPMQLEGIAKRFHNMNVQRKITELGHACQTCHGERNLDKPHLPPGAPHWGMPGGRKAVTAGTSPKMLCELWLDPARNDFETGENTGKGRTPAQMLEHVTNDPLVKWTWAPGPERTPSKGTHEEFVKNFATWVAGGTPCPAQ